MSKRDNAASVLDLRDQGYDPDAVLNFMLRLGWSMGDLPNIVTKEHAISLILQGKFKDTHANFDLSQLVSFDRKYKSRKRGYYDRKPD
jgi:glutamyl-tRNA synthetase